MELRGARAVNGRRKWGGGRGGRIVDGREGALSSGIEGRFPSGMEEKSFNCAEGCGECSLLGDVEGGLLIGAEA